MRDNTLNYYDNNASTYFESTISVNLNHIYNKFLELFLKGNKILDLGCGSGRDSLYFKKLGHKVTALDGSSKLAEKASELIGQEVIVMNFEDFNLQEKFHAIWACASLLHVKRENIEQVLNNIANNLNPKGVFYMSFKYGDTEYIDDNGRYFNCYTENTFKELMSNISGLTIEKIFKTEDVIPGRDNLIWLNVICRKNN